MCFFRKMPDVMLRREWMTIPADVYLVRSFTRGGKRWCKFYGHLVLLDTSGKAIGHGPNVTWVEI